MLTVPWLHLDATVEHFPELYHWRIEREGEDRVLYNTTRDGRREVHRDLVFHGGEGQTLQMRIFALRDVLALARDAGLTADTVRSAAAHHGIIPLTCHSFPFVVYPATSRA